MTDTFDTKKFNDLLTPPDSTWKPAEILSLSFSIGSKALNEFIKLSRIDETYPNEAEWAKHVWVFLQDGRWTTQDVADSDAHTQILLAYGRVFPVVPSTIPSCSDKSALFHPKLAAILYKRKAPAGEESSDKSSAEVSEEYLLRMIVSSRNLTGESNLEAGIWMETQDFGSSDPVLQGLLDAAFSGCPALAKQGTKTMNCEIAQKIIHADFQKWAGRYGLKKPEFLTPQAGLEGKLMALKNAAEFAAVSPFLKGPDYLKKFLPSHGNWHILTTRRLYKDIYDAEFTYTDPTGNQQTLHLRDRMRYVVQKTSGEDAEPVKLHAKMYACNFQNGAQFVSHLFVGSANFSERGLNTNYELVVHIESNDLDFCDLITSVGTETDFVRAEDAEKLPAGCVVPEAADFDAADAAARVAEEKDNDRLRQFFADVLQSKSTEPRAMDYAMDALRERDEEGKRKTWKANIKGPNCPLPEHLQPYQKMLENILAQL